MYSSKRKAYRQDENVTFLLSIIDEDDPVFVKVLFSIGHLKKYGVEITEDIIRNAVNLHRDTHAKKQLAKPSPKAVVYYARLGNLVKIGTTVNLRNRMSNINPEELLITESGSTEVERNRHRQFQDLHVHGEWFRYEGALIEHVEELRREATSP